MSFLNLWALWIAAAVIPALLILYFLKLRRREQTVPSTLLWKRAVQDLQVNAPFQKLRKNLLLLLQLLILALAIVALARPIVRTTVADAERVVLLIDRSASMNTREADGRTRLELAKEQAVRLAKTFNRRASGWRSFFSLAGADPRTQVMVMAFSDRATIVSPFTTNTSDLEDLIQRIEPTDGRTDMSEALKLAEAYMAPPTMITEAMEGTPVSAAPPAKLVLISDGRVGNLEHLVLKAGTLERLQIGRETENLGITALRTQRNYERPELLSVYLTVRNFGGEAAKTDVSLYVDGTLAATKSLELAAQPPLHPQPTSAPTDSAAPAAQDERNSASLSFELPLEHAALLEARLSHDDRLAVDNRAWAIVPPPRKLRVLVVTERNKLLDGVLPGLPLQEHPFIEPAAWEANSGGQYEADGQCTFDVVVFDKYQPRRLPMGNYLFMGCVPALEGFQPGETLRNHPLIWWDETHPVLRYVALEYVYVGESFVLAAPKQAETLVEGPQGPVLVRYADKGRQFLILTFPVERSTWWTKRSFPIFVYNALRFLGGGTEDRGSLRPGETLSIPAPAGVDHLSLLRPGGEHVALTPDAAGVAYYGGADRVGVYEVEKGVPGRDRFAVNLEDDAESDIAPPAGPLAIGSQQIKEVDAIKSATPEVWRYFIGVALAVVLLEWWLYNRRVML